MKFKKTQRIVPVRYDGDDDWTDDQACEVQRMVNPSWAKAAQETENDNKK